MIGMSLKAAKGGFFDRAKVQRSMDAATRRALSKFGSFVRQRAKTSIKKRKGISAPGQPPSSHVGLLRKNILFAYEARTKNVVIGPILLHGKVSQTALEALEHGGESMIIERGKARTINVEARPFMQPAFETELEKAPYLWENSLR